MVVMTWSFPAVGVWRVLRFKFHVMRLDGDGDAIPPPPLTTVAREPRGVPLAPGEDTPLEGDPPPPPPIRDV